MTGMLQIMLCQPQRTPAQLSCKLAIILLRGCLKYWEYSKRDGPTPQVTHNLFRYAF